MNTYNVKIGNTTYECVNGVNANVGDRVAYQHNPNNEINTVLRIEQGDIIVCSNGRGDKDKFHKIIRPVS
jgi:hypothetical protein